MKQRLLRILNALDNDRFDLSTAWRRDLPHDPNVTIELQTIIPSLRNLQGLARALPEEESP